MAAILRDSVVVRTRSRAMPLAMITMRKSTHGFRFLSYMSMGLRLAARRAAGAPLLYKPVMQFILCHEPGPLLGHLNSRTENRKRPKEVQMRPQTSQGAVAGGLYRH